MQGYLPEYELNPATWVYLSSFLTIGIFFKFHRFWSVRNLDLIALIVLAPGLLWVAITPGAGGYIWLFTVGIFFLLRLILDPLMVRRPLLEPNLNASGLAFTGIALVVFLMTNVVSGKMLPLAEQSLNGSLARYGSGYSSLYAFANLSKELPDDREGIEDPDDGNVDQPKRLVSAGITRLVAILSHLAVVIGIVVIGYRHFDNILTGVAMASLYLLLPYTAQMTPRADHVVPAALLVWTICSYRSPGAAGIFVGLGAGLIGYPLLLMPLWCSYYWQRGLIRFIAGVISGFVLLIVLLLLVTLAVNLSGSTIAASFADWPQHTFGRSTFSLEANGFWQGHEKAFRIPVMAALVVLCGSFALWPAQKNLGTLVSCSAAVMLGVQFWHPYQGGVYLGWYLPLLVLTIFRPNLEDRVAVTAVSESWFPWQIEGWVPWWIEDQAAWRKEGWIAWFKAIWTTPGKQQRRKSPQGKD